MNQKISFLLLLLIPLTGFTQSPDEDKIRLASAADWLDSKLNYVYYDGTGEKWWKNTFYLNESNEVTVKHIASDKPNTANIKNKTYTVRKFQLEDINPKSLKITEIEDSRGRIVKGQMLELRTFEFQDLIHKSINNRKASSTSFLFLSFPETLIDSVSNYAEIVKTKLEEAILASTQVYPSNSNEDLTTVMKVLTGEFKSDDGDLWKTEQTHPNVLKLNRDNGLTEFFGYDTGKEKFYLISITSQGLVQRFYTLNKGVKLQLIDESTSEQIRLETLNSFSTGGKEFFRQ